MRDPIGTTALGWMGKYMNYAGFSPTEVPAVNVGESLNPAFTPSNTSVFAFRRLSDLEFPAAGETTFKQAKFRELYDLADASNPAVYPELVKIGQTGIATVDTMQQYYVPGDGLASAGKVEKLLLDGQGNYRRGNPLTVRSGASDWEIRDIPPVRTHFDMCEPTPPRPGIHSRHSVELPSIRG